MGWLVSLLDGHMNLILHTTSMFRLRGCSKSVVEVLAVVGGVVVGEARSENILKNFPLAIDKKNDFTSIDAL